MITIEENEVAPIIVEGLKHQLAVRGVELAALHMKVSSQGGIEPWERMVTDIANKVAQAVVLAGVEQVFLSDGPQPSALETYRQLFDAMDRLIGELGVVAGLSAAKQETMRTAASALCRCLAGALDGEKTQSTSPEYAAQAAGRFVQLCREVRHAR